MQIPEQVQNILQKLSAAGFEAYLVGGCVRDLLLVTDIKVKIPKDWDITTNALPADIIKVFSDAKYENGFGTVIVKIPEAERTDNLKYVEVTTYRSEGVYSDNRHPDEVKFEKKLEKDLERRDFTINAMAMDGEQKLVDLFGGRKDLTKKIIRAVGEPTDRFKEDALRMMRAIRFAAQLDFKLEPKTQRAISKLAGAIKFVSKERIHDELVKILSSSQPSEGIMLLHETKLLQYIIPELESCVGVAQNKHHTYTVFKHLIESLRYTKNDSYQVRIASLLHDIAKPVVKKIVQGEITFYNHDYVGAKMTVKIMRRLKFSVKDIERVSTLVRNHMFYYNVGEVTSASVRRLIRKVGKDNLQDLIDLRVADRLGSGTPKAMPYKLRHLQYMMEKVQNDPVSVKMLKLNGDELMLLLKVKPGPKIGAILDVLLAEVIDNPHLNTKEQLVKRGQELNKLDLQVLRDSAKEKIKQKITQDDQNIKKNFYVK